MRRGWSLNKKKAIEAIRLEITWYTNVQQLGFKNSIAKIIARTQMQAVIRPSVSPIHPPHLLGHFSSHVARLAKIKKKRKPCQPSIHHARCRLIGYHAAVVNRKTDRKVVSKIHVKSSDSLRNRYASNRVFYRAGSYRTLPPRIA